MNILANILSQTDSSTPSIWQNPTFLAFMGILIAIPVAVLIGRFLAKSFRVPELSGRIGMVLWCIMFSAIVISIKPLKFGVDLRGGVTIIGQMNDQPGVAKEDQVTIQKIIPILKERIDPSGVREIVIRALGNDKMEVIIPDVEKEEAERIWERLTSAGQLFFRIVADDNQHPTLTKAARDTAEERRTKVFSDSVDDEGNPKQIGEWVQLAREQPLDGAVGARLPFKFMPTSAHVLRDKNSGVLVTPPLNMFAGDDIGRKEFNEWCFRQDPPINDLQILMAYPPKDRQNVKGEYLTSVKKGFDEQANPRIDFGLNSQGGKRMFSFTSRNKPDNGRHSLMGIVLDGKLQSAPRINEPIRSNGVIEGSFTDAEIDGYVSVLSSGKLDVALRKNWISMDQIRSTLGEELKTKGLMAIGISLGLVLIFMCIYYRFCGFVACFALALNLIFTMAILMLINVNLTLTGLAGLVLTIGMSVDANVLIFERIREELNRGAALRMAIRNGFDRATTTIVDANLTTLITAVILYVIGTDQIRSFSVTLIVGILMCMFTAIYCSRLVFTIAERRRWITSLKMAKIVGNTLLDFLGKRHIAAVMSVVLITIGLVGFFARGKGILDTDLAGGSTARVQFVAEQNTDQIRAALEAAPYTYNDDPIRYSVTQMKDNEKAFKIDSSLPVIDDISVEGADKVPRLDQIITDVFKDQLVMLNVEFDPSAITFSRDGVEIEAGAAPSSGGPAFGAGLDHPDMASGNGGGPYMGPAFAALHTLPQEETTPAAGSEQEGETEQEGEPDLSAPVDVPEQPEATEASETQEPVRNARLLTEAKVALSFAHRITGESVKGYIDDAARKLGDIPLEKDADITVTGPTGTESIQDHATDWTVTINVYDPNDARRILNEVKSTMNSQTYFASSSGVGGQVASSAQQKALLAMFASLLGIIAYVWIRFQNVAFGLAAIVALVHDVLVVLGAIALSYWLAGVFGFLLIEDFRISLSVVAALLTIIGYSLNDTIVVFDRIREVRGKRTDITQEMINKSISQTLSRTILTSITTLIVVLILYVLGGESIHAFAFALVIGVIVGTYSSIFVASPTLLWLMNRGVAPPAVMPDRTDAKQS